MDGEDKCMLGLLAAGAIGGVIGLLFGDSTEDRKQEEEERKREKKRRSEENRKKWLHPSSRIGHPIPYWKKIRARSAENQGKIGPDYNSDGTLNRNFRLPDEQARLVAEESAARPDWARLDQMGVNLASGQLMPIRKKTKGRGTNKHKHLGIPDGIRYDGVQGGYAQFTEMNQNFAGYGASFYIEVGRVSSILIKGRREEVRRMYEKFRDYLLNTSLDSC